MGTMASLITSLMTVYSNVHSGADQRKHQSSASLAFVWGIHRWPVSSPQKGPVRGKCFHLMTSLCWNASLECPHDSYTMRSCKLAKCTIKTRSLFTPTPYVYNGHLGPFYWHGLTLVPAWNYMSGKVWFEIIYPSPNFNGATVEVIGFHIL